LGFASGIGDIRRKSFTSKQLGYSFPGDTDRLNSGIQKSSVPFISLKSWVTLVFAGKIYLGDYVFSLFFGPLL